MWTKIQVEKVIAASLMLDSSIFFPLQANGIQFGSLIESIVSILAAVIISLAVNQLLALLIIGFLPFLMVPGFIQWVILSAYTSHYKRGTDEAEKVNLGRYLNDGTILLWTHWDHLENILNREVSLLQM